MFRNLTCIAIVLACAPVLSAQAQELVSRTHVQNAVGVCQGALPSFEGAIRKRPLGINNEGSTPAFVSCTVNSEASYLAQVIQDFAILLTNRGPVTELTCTLVDGIAPATSGPLAGAFPPVYYPKTIAIPDGTAGGTSASIAWDLDDRPEGFIFPALSCLLPPGVEINFIQHLNDQIVG